MQPDDEPTPVTIGIAVLLVVVAAALTSLVVLVWG